MERSGASREHNIETEGDRNDIIANMLNELAEDKEAKVRELGRRVSFWAGDDMTSDGLSSSEEEESESERESDNDEMW